MKKGLNIDMLEDIMSKTSLPCVASGGVSSLKDLKLLKVNNYPTLKGVITGKAIYDKLFNLKEALNLLKNDA